MPKLMSAKGWRKTHIVFGNINFGVAACGIAPSPAWPKNQPLLKKVCKVCAHKIDQNDLAWLKAKKIVRDFPEITMERFIAVAKSNDFLQPLEHQVDTIAEWCILLIAERRDLVKEFAILEKLSK